LAYNALRDGAAGVDMGRNIWQSRFPTSMIKAVRSIVHGSSNPEAAFEEFIKNSEIETHIESR
jgi:putative autoinducer-2 (AI-2) aldolase